MVSPTINRRLGLAGNAAFKAPVKVLAATNITLSGQQTIDGVAVLAINAAGVPDRVLVIGQTDRTQNGIYDVSTGTWTRSLDANGNYDLKKGSSVLVTDGAVYGSTYWQLVADDPITVNTTEIQWSQTLSGSLSVLTFIQAGTGAVTRAGQTKMRESVTPEDFGAVGDGITDDTDAVQKALTYLRLRGGGCLSCIKVYGLTQTVLAGSNTLIRGGGNGSKFLALPSFVGTNAGDNCYLVSNYNKAASSITDENIAVVDMGFDYGAVVIAGGGAHAFRMRMVRNVKAINCTFYNGEDGTAFLACDDTLVMGCSCYDFINCSYDHWEHPTNARVIGCYAETASSNQIVNFNPEDSANIATDPADGFIMDTCQFKYTGGDSLGCVIEPLTAGAYVKNVQITNNHFNNVKLALRGDCRNFLIAYNSFVNQVGPSWVVGMGPQLGGTGSDVQLIGNRALDCETTFPNGAVFLMHVDNYYVAGNMTTGTTMFASLAVTGYVGVVGQNNFTIGTSGKEILGTDFYTQWTAPTLLNSWVNYGGLFMDTGYCRDQFGVVRLRGKVKSGTSYGTDIFVLPDGCRPSADLEFAVTSANVHGAVQVATGGNVTALAGSTLGTSVGFSLSGISFIAN